MANRHKTRAASTKRGAKTRSRLEQRVHAELDRAACPLPCAHWAVPGLRAMQQVRSALRADNVDPANVPMALLRTYTERVISARAQWARLRGVLTYANFAFDGVPRVLLGFRAETEPDPSTGAVETDEYGQPRECILFGAPDNSVAVPGHPGDNGLACVVTRDQMRAAVRARRNVRRAPDDIAAKYNQWSRWHTLVRAYTLLRLGGGGTQIEADARDAEALAVRAIARLRGFCGVFRRWRHMVLAAWVTSVQGEPSETMRALAVFNRAHDTVTINDVNAEMHTARLRRNLSSASQCAGRAEQEASQCAPDAREGSALLARQTAERCDNATGGTAALVWALWHVVGCAETERVCDRSGLTRMEAAIFASRVRSRPWPRTCGCCTRAVDMCTAQSERETDVITQVALCNVVDNTRTGCHARLSDILTERGVTAEDIEFCCGACGPAFAHKIEDSK